MTARGKASFARHSLGKIDPIGVQAFCFLFTKQSFVAYAARSSPHRLDLGMQNVTYDPRVTK
jgi:hypothetical protein